jgi:hypothetical protein
MHGIKALGFTSREMKHPHGTNLESGLLDALNDPARVAGRHCIRFDDRKRSFHIVELYAARSQLLRQAMTQKQPQAEHHEDEHLGAVEGDKPSDAPNQGNPNGPGVDTEGLPNDPVGTAQDRIGALLDETEGG